MHRSAPTTHIASIGALALGKWIQMDCNNTLGTCIFHC